jgi:hypothetical protein
VKPVRLQVFHFDRFAFDPRNAHAAPPTAASNSDYR